MVYFVSQFLVGHSINSSDGMAEAANYLLGLMCKGASATGQTMKGVLVKGGHFGTDDGSGDPFAKDFLLLARRNADGGWDKEGLWLSSPRWVECVRVLMESDYHGGS